MIDYVAVLLHLHPGASWSLNGDDYSGLVWDESNATPKPSQGELDAAWPAVQQVLAWNPIRDQRDRLLAASDWTQVADAPVNKQAWAAYRQQLRDIPQDFASPDDVVWPEAP